MEESFQDPSQKEMLMELIKNYEKTQQDIIQFSFKFEQVATNNEELKEQINEAFLEQSAFRDCIRCHTKFSPVLNNEVNIFHLF